MNRKINVLVTGVGAIIGYGIIKSLRASKYDCNIIGMDIYADAVGQAWCDSFVQAIPAADPNYVPFVLKVMEEHQIDLIMFGTEQEINRLSSAEEEMGAQYKKLVLNRKEIIALSDDKWATYQMLRQNDLPTIPSMIEGSYDAITQALGTPFLLKPRKSYAGKGMVVIHDESEFQYRRSRLPQEQFMVQKLIGDDEHEYTAATFGFGDGTCLDKPIVFSRKLSQEGATAKARSIEVPEIEEQIKILTGILKPIGPTNYQFRKEGEQYLLLEVNPRISSSTSIRTAFGYNEAEMCITWYLHGNRPEQPEIHTGEARRYIADWVDVE